MQTDSSTPRIALVTGAAQGIGYSIAIRLADDGLDVAVNDVPAKSEQLNKVVEEICAKGRRSISVPADVSLEEGVKRMVDAVVEDLGGLDVMVANAGIVILASFLETTAEQFDRIMAINARGPMLCYKYAAMQMIKQGRGGRIIGASSAAGKRGTMNFSAYSATKFAVRGLTQSAALELGKHGITVNAYAPGVIHTPMALLVDGTDDRGATAKALSGTPPDTPEAEPEVVASLVSYLSKLESHFITGQTISVDGGMRMD